MGPLENRLVDELAVHLNHTDAIFVCFFEYLNDFPSHLNLDSTRAEDAVDDLDLVGMNAQFSAKARLFGPQGVFFQRLHIFEVLHVRGVQRREQFGSPAGDHKARPGIDQLPAIFADGYPKIIGVVGRAEGKRE